MGKFKVGDKVKVIDAGSSVLKDGDIGIIVRIDSVLAKVDVKGKENVANWVLFGSLKSAESKPTKKQRIKALEERVEALEKLAEEYFKVPVEPSIERPKEEPRIPKGLMKTPNQLRAEIIEKAKGFVEDVKKDSHGVRRYTVGSYVCAAKFIVNKEKRAVTALIFHHSPAMKERGETRKVKAKGIAKCNPSDVFNEHIGKAIALGRALGLDVSEFEGAVQPTHATGQVCEIQNWNRHNGNLATLSKPFKDRGFYHSYYDGWLAYENFKIINDTNAIYGEVE